MTRLLLFKCINESIPLKKQPYLQLPQKVPQNSLTPVF